MVFQIQFFSKDVPILFDRMTTVRVSSIYYSVFVYTLRNEKKHMQQYLLEARRTAHAYSDAGQACGLRVTTRKLCQDEAQMADIYE
jgi:hypothetical protein